MKTGRRLNFDGATPAAAEHLRVRKECFWAQMGYFDPLKEPQGALCGGPSSRGGGRDRGWTRRSQRPRARPGSGRTGPRRTSTVSGRGGLGEFRAPRGRRRRCRPSLRGSSVSTRPTERSSDDRSTRNAAWSTDCIRVEESVAKTSSSRARSPSANAPTPLRTWSACDRPSATARTSSTTRITPRCAFFENRARLRRACRTPRLRTNQRLAQPSMDLFDSMPTAT